MFAHPKSDEYISQDDVDSWYEKIYNWVKEQKDVADKHNKVLFLFLGEDHGSKKSLFLCEIFIDVAAKLSIKPFLTEGNPTMLDSLSIYKKGMNMQFLAPIIKAKGLELKAAEKDLVEIVSKKPEQKAIEPDKFYLVKEDDKDWQLFKANQYGKLDKLSLMTDVPGLYLEAGLMHKKPQDLTIEDRLVIQEQCASFLEESQSPKSPIDKELQREAQMAKSIAEEKEHGIFLSGITHLKGVTEKLSLNSHFHVALFNISNFSKEKTTEYLSAGEDDEIPTEEDKRIYPYIKSTTLFAMSDKLKQLVVEKDISDHEKLESMIDRASSKLTAKSNIPSQNQY